MIEFDYPEHYCNNIWSAIKLAEDLKSAGEYDLFRGQRHTYDIQPSILREGVNKSLATSNLEKFTHWVHQTPELRSLHGNREAILAVAQHYGIKTPLLDFSYSPKIAGFFASNNGQVGDVGTIICINKERFSTSWKDLNATQLTNEGHLLTEILEIDVKNLWRLQAQKGAFIRSHVDSSLLEMFSFMLHIYFPQEQNINVEKEEVIYPKNKSHLEVLLDQYFLIDGYPERKIKMEALFGSAVIRFDENTIKKEIESYFINNRIPDIHPSWNTEYSKKWFIEPNERINDKVQCNVILKLSLDEVNNDMETYVFNFVLDILDKKESGDKLINWTIKSKGDKILYFDQEGVKESRNEFTEFELSEMVDVIYSGMRTLPYSNCQISKAISKYLTMACLSNDNIMEQSVGVELEGGRVRGRGFCNRSKLISALRNDFFDSIKPEKLNELGKLAFRDTLFTASYVKSSYIFEDFIDLYVEDIIPSIAAVAIEGLVINLNPVRVEVMGQS